MITVEIRAMDLSGIANNHDAAEKAEAYHFPRNILINFGGSNLEFDRLCNKKFRKRKPL